jgi:hypothetical protein
LVQFGRMLLVALAGEINSLKRNLELDLNFDFVYFDN